MSRMIFVNLPVADLDASMAFYKSIGFTNNPHFTDETAACMLWSEAINVMLHTHAKWRVFTSRPIPPVTSSEVMLALSCDSRGAVDAINEAAAAHGGTADVNPVQDHGFMYNRSLLDPGGHSRRPRSTIMKPVDSKSWGGSSPARPPWPRDHFGRQIESIVSPKERAVHRGQRKNRYECAPERANRWPMAPPTAGVSPGAVGSANAASTAVLRGPPSNCHSGRNRRPAHVAGAARPAW
jgi:predicted lactoylglutathione lyase